MKLRRLGWRWAPLLAVAVVTAVVVSVEGATGSAPTANNQYSACLKSGQITGVTIAPATPTVCTKPAVQITWSQTGPQGIQGVPGTSVVSTPLDVGNTHCPNGGGSFAVGTVTT